MTAPDKIWAWEVNYPISKGHGEKKWFPWKLKPMTYTMYDGWFPRKRIDIEQVFTSYTRTDIAEAEHRSGYELARAKAAELGAHIVAYDVAMNE